jgi:hypothetical protein
VVYLGDLGYDSALNVVDVGLACHLNWPARTIILLYGVVTTFNIYFRQRYPF